MTAPPKRRWFSFSLRTLLILVALVAVFMSLGPTVLTVYRRRQACISIQADGGTIYFPADFIDNDLEDEVPETVVVSPLRAWMGDVPVVRVTLPKSATEDELEWTKRQFPEAESIVIRENGSGGGFF